jgi:ubiquinone/menaquinone biosynthesis C-methylase UbiE
MNEPYNSWKSFYRKQYGGQWRGFAQSLAKQPYHVRYQNTCLAPLQHITGRMLEVGVGRGDLLSQMPHESCDLYGCDLSEGNIAGCAERFSELQREVHLCHADAENIPYQSNSFDAVYSLSVMWYVPDYQTAISEMFRVAKPGGLVLFDMLNAFHITSISNHLWRMACRAFGRELGHTSLASPSSLLDAIKSYASEYNLYGNYLLLPAGLPVLKEAGNLCRFVPSMAYAMTESPLRGLSHKLLVVAKKNSMK